jgi:hypothetical protein
MRDVDGHPPARRQADSFGPSRAVTAPALSSWIVSDGDGL